MRELSWIDLCLGFVVGPLVVVSDIEGERLFCFLPFTYLDALRKEKVSVTSLVGTVTNNDCTSQADFPVLIRSVPIWITSGSLTIQPERRTLCNLLHRL